MAVGVMIRGEVGRQSESDGKYRPSKLRRTAVAVIFVIIYMWRHMTSVNFILDSTRAERREGTSGSELNRVLNLFPEDSFHRVAFVTFSYVRHDDRRKLVDYLLPAVDTWAAPPENSTGAEVLGIPPLYVVLSRLSRGPFEEACVEGGAGLSDGQLSLCRRLRPVYVDCPEGKYGESPCCKQQEGLLELHRGGGHPPYDWYAFFDDDTYLRKEYIAEILHALPRSPDFPMAAVSYSQEPRDIGLEPMVCRRQGGDEFLYPWGMPIFYSRGALEMMARGYRAKSLVKQCAAFNITHDVGNAMLNWMYSLPMARLPPLQGLPYLRDDQIGSHWVGREDMRLKFWNKTKTFRIRAGPHKGLMRTQRALPEGAFSFYATHKSWGERQYRPPHVARLSMISDPKKTWYPNATGYRQTLAFGRNGDPRHWGEGIWHTMRLEDCNSTV